jgi:hypothetical protein
MKKIMNSFPLIIISSALTTPSADEHSPVRTKFMTELRSFLSPKHKTLILILKNLFFIDINPSKEEIRLIISFSGYKIICNFF